MSLTRLVRGSLRYGPMVVAEVVLCGLILEAVNASGYGVVNPVPTQRWYPEAAFLLVTCAMGFGEWRLRLYRRVWSVASLNDAFAIGLAVVEATLLVTIINFLFPEGSRPLRLGAPALAAPAVVIGIGLLRLLPRLTTSSPRPSGNRLLVVIPDESGYATVKALIQQPNPGWTPVAGVTTGTADLGRTLLGVPVIGSADTLLPEQPPIFTAPAAESWSPSPSGWRLRHLSADDLVGRDEHEIDLELSANEIRNRVVLVTGAAGSIGSELCRLIAGMGPKRLILVDINESGLFDLSEELRVAGGLDLREALVSIIDHDQLLGVFADERPEIVFHAGAYKHVPMLESHPIQAVLANVVGTRNTLRCSHAAGVKRFILISTDKGASKHSVMGCTKRLCEELVLAYRGPMSCWAVRFGNVVGSRGSVVPLFERQIEHGGPVTITHPDVSRYMMTIREASSLVLSSLTIGRPGHLYMLDMGDPIKIYDLANDLIRSRGLRPDVDVKIVITGLRPGERMTEDLLAADEGWRPTDHPAIREVVSPMIGKEEDLAWTVERLERLANEGKSDELVRVLKNAVQVQAEPEQEPDLPGVPKADERALDL